MGCQNLLKKRNRRVANDYNSWVVYLKQELYGSTEFHRKSGVEVNVQQEDNFST